MAKRKKPEEETQSMNYYPVSASTMYGLHDKSITDIEIMIYRRMMDMEAKGYTPTYVLMNSHTHYETVERIMRIRRIDDPRKLCGLIVLLSNDIERGDIKVLSECL